MIDARPFLWKYEALIKKYSVDYEKVDHRNIDSAALKAFFLAEFTEASFPQVQRFDFEGLLGRLRSSSYVPPPDSPEFASLTVELRSLYEHYQDRGGVDILYDCKIFVGGLS